MKWRCLFGRHNWNGCRCERCGKTRDEQHDWETIESVTSSEPGWYGDTPINIIRTSSFSRCRICGKKTEETSSEDMECRH